MMKFVLPLSISATLSLSLACDDVVNVQTFQLPAIQSINPLDTLRKFFERNSAHIADGFDFPVGPPDAKGYYNAQPFGINLHLGDDWNGKGGGNTDLGDPVFSIANGYVAEATDHGGGWGNVVRVIHAYHEDSVLHFVESLYAHLDTVLVSIAEWLRRGEQLGTIGNCDGAYMAHLHLEIRDSVGMTLGGGYSDMTTGYLKPAEFIKSHRPK